MNATVETSLDTPLGRIDITPLGLSWEGENQFYVTSGTALIEINGESHVVRGTVVLTKHLALLDSYDSLRLSAPRDGMYDIGPSSAAKETWRVILEDGLRDLVNSPEWPTLLGTIERGKAESLVANLEAKVEQLHKDLAVLQDSLTAARLNVVRWSE